MEQKDQNLDQRIIRVEKDALVINKRLTALERKIKETEMQIRKLDRNLQQKRK